MQWEPGIPGRLFRGHLETPVGGLLVVYTGELLVSADWVDGAPAGEGPLDPLPEDLREPFRAAWEGRSLPPFRVSAGGLSPFARLALQRTIQIPYGSVMSYGALADWIGFPRHARQVGAAMRLSPLPILFATHRVVHADGSPAASQRGGHAERLRRLERDRLA